MLIASRRDMDKKLRIWLARCDRMDWAVLYLRLFAGGVMLFHNVGKMQTYNEIVDTYPSFLYLDNAAVFVIVAVIEVFFSVLLILGLWVRLSAFVLSLGVVSVIFWLEFAVGEAAYLWLGIYLFLLVSGGGLYAFDSVVTTSGRRK